MLSAVTTSSACLRRQVVYFVCGSMLSMCVRACLMYLSVGCLVVTTKHPTYKYIRHAHTETTYSHIPNKQFDDANKQRSSNSTKQERRPPEEGQTIVTETCRVLVMCFTNIFKNLVF